jgi:hypothetical protein
MITLLLALSLIPADEARIATCKRNAQKVEDGINFNVLNGNAGALVFIAPICKDTLIPTLVMKGYKVEEDATANMYLISW